MCLNNLQQIAKAVLLYVSDNEGAFPFAAAKNANMVQVMSPPSTPEGHQSADWIYWQSGPNDKLATSDDPGALVIHQLNLGGIGKYLGGCNPGSLSGLQTLRCPDDARLNNSVMVQYTPDSTGNNTPYPLVNSQTPYPFSYVLNALMSSGNSSGNGDPLLNGAVVARTLAKVKDPATKILVFEEDPRTIDDGNAVLTPRNDGLTDMIAIRHDGIEIDDPTPNGVNNPRDPVFAHYTGNPPQLAISNPGKTGNVAFCDGHGEVIPRAVAHLKDHWAPDPTLFPTLP
jgi:prepilin-type processing-associated H-X9-DG protein